MRHEPKKLVEDISRAIDEVATFCAGKSFCDIENDRQLQLVVERELEIIGEALARLKRDHLSLALRIPDAEKIIGMRNVLAHGYDVLEYEILWDVVENKLPDLKDCLKRLDGCSSE